MEIYFGIYLAKNIFVSPEGYVKLYLYHCTASNSMSIQLISMCSTTILSVTSLDRPISSFLFLLSAYHFLTGRLKVSQELNWKKWTFLGLEWWP